MKKEAMLALYQDTAQSGISVTSFMTGVTIFFTGLLITRFEFYDLSIKIPILFLILSTFGFLYSTLIYANASGDLARLNASRFHREMNLGDSIGEYIGVYFMVLAIPLVINVLTTDLFLRLSTLIVALGGLATYHASGFSIMQNHFQKKHMFMLSVIVVLEIALYFTQFMHNIFVTLATLLILFLLAITYISRDSDKNTI
jgi:hypothetical protein